MNTNKETENKENRQPSQLSLQRLLCVEVPLEAALQPIGIEEKVFYGNIYEVAPEVAEYALAHPHQQVYIADKDILLATNLDIPYYPREKYTPHKGNNNGSHSPFEEETLAPATMREQGSTLELANSLYPGVLRAEPKIIGVLTALAQQQGGY